MGQSCDSVISHDVNTNIDMADTEVKFTQAVHDSAQTAQLPPEMEVNLSDDRPAQAPDFFGATLELGADGAQNDDVEYKPAGLQRDRPFSASMVSRKSTTSTKSKTSMSPGIHVTEFSTKSLFSYKGESFEKAVEAIQDQICKSDLDGQIRGAWVLTEIDHWDNERERVVILTENSILTVRYDFIANKLGEYRRIMMHIIDNIQIGDLVYPPQSVMPPRQHGGVRFSWDKGEGTTFGQRWNPWAGNIPYITLAHHPLAYTEKEKETITYNVDDFYESVLQAITKVHKAKYPDKTFVPVEEPIVVESYASVSSLIFNQSHLGFNRERGGVSF